MDVWVSLVAAALGALAGLGGAWLVTRGQARTTRRARLEDAYAEVLVAGHNAETFLSEKPRSRPVALPAELAQALKSALAVTSLLAPYDTHEAIDEWAGKLGRPEIWPEILANDVRANVDRWETALLHMRRDLDRPTYRLHWRNRWDVWRAKRRR